MRHHRWIELFSYYDCEIRYHPGKANMVADALSMKERVKPKRVRAMNMILQSSIKYRILAAQKEAVDEFAVLRKGLDKMIEQRSDGTLYYLDRIWVPFKGEVRTLIIDEAHKSKYSVHPRADKMYYDLRDRYWWPGMKKDIAEYVSKCLTYLKVKAEHQSPSGLDVHLPLVEFSYNNSYHSSVRCAPFEALYGRKCRSPIMWAEVGEGQLIGHELVQETTEKISQIKDRLKAARDHQKSYADKRRKPLEFSVGDYVLLKVSPWKGVVRFGKKGKFEPRFVGPFEIIEKVGPVAYRLDLPEELNGVHDTFHVSNRMGAPAGRPFRCLSDIWLLISGDAKVEGEITYNGHKLHEFVPRKTSAYISQNDVHAGEMTVKETLDISARCQGAGSRIELLEECARRRKSIRDLPRSISRSFHEGSRHKRRCQQFITYILLRILGLGFLAAILLLVMNEALESLVDKKTFDLFDDIILLSEGQIMYQGPRENALEFFESCGFMCPERKGTADFLQEVTSRKEQAQHWADRNKP
ncbi:putative reverse transcriptase domain-containing protein [Tanacetum coccineum]